MGDAGNAIMNDAEIEQEMAKLIVDDAQRHASEQQEVVQMDQEQINEFHLDDEEEWPLLPPIVNEPELPEQPGLQIVGELPRQHEPAQDGQQLRLGQGVVARPGQQPPVHRQQQLSQGQRAVVSQHQAPLQQQPQGPVVEAPPLAQPPVHRQQQLRQGQRAVVPQHQAPRLFPDGFLDELQQQPQGPLAEAPPLARGANQAPRIPPRLQQQQLRQDRFQQNYPAPRQQPQQHAATRQQQQANPGPVRNRRGGRNQRRNPYDLSISNLAAFLVDMLDKQLKTTRKNLQDRWNEDDDDDNAVV